uniref:Pre-rRNA-processing protein Ipi1 N-terminal domain-containing protein n=1 Tax=Globisporangium ultimum (strain ATCC 200006 / CBS 805.95 / DAOM BR144) TaxID=431595 RepID=K3XBJ5_GLOUD
MNGYVQRKCRSEQKLMNELPKLLASRDFASKKMGELMKELAFFYVAPVLPRIPHSVLKDLCALVGNLKDKKEDLRLARMALCFLARIVDQFELLYQRDDPQQRTQSFELSVSVLATLLKVFEKSELNHASLPRQHTCLKLYALLCRIFRKTDALVQRTTPLLQKSPIWTVLSGDKKAIASATGKKEFPSQLAALAALFHGVRFHMSASEQADVLELMFQGAFLPHHAVVSRHAAATILSLFETSTSEHAKSVIKTLEWYLVKFRPLSLRVGADPLTTIYLVRLCGQISRLPVIDSEINDGAACASKNSATTNSVSNLLDFSYEDASGNGVHAQAAGGAPSPPPSPIARQRRQQQRLDGVQMTNSLATRLHGMLLDLLMAAAEQKPSTSTAATWIPNAVVLVAIEETIQGSNAASCFRKVRGSVCVFEIVASVLAKALRDAAATNSVVLLHRVCRVVQFAVEALDGAVLQLAGNAPHQPQFFDRIAELVVNFASHANPFIACESLRALVWLLPRPAAQSSESDDWEKLLARLLALPLDHVLPEARVAIADALFHRAVINSSLHDHDIDAALLHKCLVVTLAWFQMAPCEWHAPVLVRIWHTALRKASTMDDAVFDSIAAVLDFQHHQRKDPTELVHRSTLDFLHRIGSKYVVRQKAWFHALVLRLTKHMLLGSQLSRRLSVRVLVQLRHEAQQLGSAGIVEHVTILLTYMQQTSDNQEELAKRQPDVFVATRIHSQSTKDVLGVQDLLLLSERDEVRVSAPATTMNQSFDSNNQTSATVFDGVF